MTTTAERAPEAAAQLDLTDDDPYRVDAFLIVKGDGVDAVKAVKQRGGEVVAMSLNDSNALVYVRFPEPFFGLLVCWFNSTKADPTSGMYEPGGLLFWRPCQPKAAS